MLFTIDPSKVIVKYLGHVISADMKDDLDIGPNEAMHIMHKSMFLLVVFICARTM